MTLLDKLLKEADWCEWKDLHDSFIRDTLFWVKGDIDPFEAAEAIAENNTEYISKAIASESILRPDGFKVEEWRKQEQRFLTLIVSPFVIIKPMDMAGYAKILERQAEVLKRESDSKTD